VKNAKSEGEAAKVSVRNNRKEANDYLKKLKGEGLSEDRLKNVEAVVQELTDETITKIDALIVRKEADIMTI
jgi:ribosome recycling factor